MIVPKGGATPSASATATRLVRWQTREGAKVCADQRREAVVVAEAKRRDDQMLKTARAREYDERQEGVRRQLWEASVRNQLVNAETEFVEAHERFRAALDSERNRFLDELLAARSAERAVILTAEGKRLACVLQ